MNVGVLASGTGTNLQAILDRVHGREGVTVTAVGSDQPGASALERAARAGVPTGEFPLRGDRGARDGALADWLESHGVELVVLAGYMALLTPGFLARFPSRVINAKRLKLSAARTPMRVSPSAMEATRFAATPSICARFSRLSNPCDTAMVACCSSRPIVL